MRIGAFDHAQLLPCWRHARNAFSRRRGYRGTRLYHSPDRHGLPHRRVRPLVVPPMVARTAGAGGPGRGGAGCLAAGDVHRARRVTSPSADRRAHDVATAQQVRRRWWPTSSTKFAQSCQAAFTSCDPRPRVRGMERAAAAMHAPGLARFRGCARASVGRRPRRKTTMRRPRPAKLAHPTAERAAPRSRSGVADRCRVPKLDRSQQRRGGRPTPRPDVRQGAPGSAGLRRPHSPDVSGSRRAGAPCGCWSSLAVANWRLARTPAL